MNPYEGLNLPELLQLMHELVRPAPVSWLPQTPGWWLLLGWLLALALVAGLHWAQRRRANRYRRRALAALRRIAVDAERSPFAAAAQIAGLLKRTALAAYSRQAVASLYGDEWADFLRRTAGGDAEVEAAAATLATAAYRSDIDGRALIEPARRWIEAHRA